MPIRPPQRPFRIDEIEVVTKEKLVAVPNPEPVIKYVDVIKEVEKVVLRDDPALLEKLNSVLKENAELRNSVEMRKKLGTIVSVAEPEVKVVVEKQVEKVVVSNQKKELVLFIIAFVIGVILCLLIKK